MAHERDALEAKSGSATKGRHPGMFAFIQATERFLAGNAEDRLSPKGDSEMTRLFDAPDILDRWTISNLDRRSRAVRKLTPGKRRRASSFVELLLHGTPEQCEAAARAALRDLGDPHAVAEELFAPAARMLGEKWNSDDCSFVAVTMGVSHMQRLLRTMISEMPREDRSDKQRSLLLSPAPGEQHAFGLSIVDDAFRRAGWDVDCCGCGEDAEVLRLVARNHYSVFGVSISTARLLPALGSTIGKLRAKSLNKTIIVIAGGSLAIEKPQAAIDVGCDFVAVTAQSAVKLSESVLALRADASDAQLAAE